MNKFLKFTVALTIMLAFNLSIFTNKATAQFSGGNGTSGNPYLITTAAQLAQLATYVNDGTAPYADQDVAYKLDNNIDLSDYQTGAGWTPIGRYSTTKPFKGVFDGNNKVITKLYIKNTAVEYVGLFGFANNATIKNFGIVETDISSTLSPSYTGGVVGYNTNSAVTNCYVTGKIISYAPSNESCAGGVAGYSYNSVVEKCYFIGQVSSMAMSGNPLHHAYAGGIVGYNHDSKVWDCYSVGSVKSNGYKGNNIAAYAGGIAGRNYLDGDVKRCYSACKVYAEHGGGSTYSSRAGGIVGVNNGSNVSDCAALNPCVGVTSSGSSSSKRIVGYQQGECLLSNNVAFTYMRSQYNIIPVWDDPGASNLNGESIAIEDIVSDGTFGGRFTAVNGWTAENNKLPGLFGETVEIPMHIRYLGTETDPYLITSAMWLAQMAWWVNLGGDPYCLVHYKLTNNLDLSDYGENFNGGKGWIPINQSNIGISFYGVFDGNGKTISGLYINNDNLYYAGLFGLVGGVGPIAIIKNLGVINVNINSSVITGTGYAGGVACQVLGGTMVLNCYTTGTITTNGHIGGIVGSNTGSVSNCYSTCTVNSSTANGYVGGVVGYNSNNGSSSCNVSNCYSTGAITANGYVGGVVGYNHSDGSSSCNVSNCYSTGTITANGYAGGVVGFLGYNSSVSNCVAANSSITCTGTDLFVGRIVGKSNGGTLTNNYANTAMLVNGATVDGGAHDNENGANETLATFKIFAFYNTAGNWNSAAWSIAQTLNPEKDWRICNGQDLPYLQWEEEKACTPSIAPTITTTTLPNGAVGTAYGQTLTATGTTPITWSIENGNLPTNLSLSSTGTISGTPTTSGTFNFTVKATNSGGSDTKALSITINVAPTITTTTLPDGIVSTAYEATLSATGTTPITWSIENGNLPTGLSLNTANGDIYGTPTATGTFNFTVKAINSAGSDTKALSITIGTAAVAPIITTTTLPNGTEGTAYNQPLTATGTAPITWTVSVGNLPTGLSLSATGIISGTPTTAGTFNFTAKATNSAGNDTKALSITINAVIIPPTITTTTLPDGITGTAYSKTLTATGTTPINWAIANGNLPTGLTLSTSGTISGTPTTTGTFNFTVKATNSAGNDTKALTITIGTTAIAPIITTTTLPNGTEGTAYNQPLTATGTAPITWSLQSGNLPAGLTLSAEGVITGTPTAAGTSNFTVKATNSAGSDTKVLSIKIESIVGIVETDNEPALRIYPNPTNGELHIGYAMCDNAICDIEIYDLMGRRVNNCQLSTVNCQLKIDVSHLPPGMYFLKIGEKTAKFVKE